MHDTGNPKVFRFSDIDAYRSSIRTLNVDFTPLVRKISAEQIILNLPGCDVNYTKSFPRIYDAELYPNATAVGFSMDDGVPIRFNGVERDRSVIVIGRGGAAYNSVTRTPRQYASIIFTPEIEGRGWPEGSVNFKMLETSILAQDSLRRLVHQVLSVAPQLVDAFEVSAVQIALRPCWPPSTPHLPMSSLQIGHRARTRSGNSARSGRSRRRCLAT